MDEVTFCVSKLVAMSLSSIMIFKTKTSPVLYVVCKLGHPALQCYFVFRRKFHKLVFTIQSILIAKCQTSKQDGGGS